MSSHEIPDKLLIKRWMQIDAIAKQLLRLSKCCASLNIQMSQPSLGKLDTKATMGELADALLQLVGIFNNVRLPSINSYSASRKTDLLEMHVKERLGYFEESILGEFTDGLVGSPYELVEFATHELVALKQAVNASKRNFAKSNSPSDLRQDCVRFSESWELFDVMEKAFCKHPIVRKQLDERAMQLLNETTVIPLKETDQLILDLTKSECFYKKYHYDLGQDKTLILQLCIEADGEFVSFKKFDIKNAGRHIDEMPGDLTDLFDRQPRLGTRIPKEILNTLNITLKKS